MRGRGGVAGEDQVGAEALLVVNTARGCVGAAREWGYGCGSM